MSRLGSKILEARTRKGLSRKQLAKKVGVAEKYIEEVELGKKIISESLLSKITNVIGEDVNDISMSFEESVFEEEKESKIQYKTPKNTATDNESWTSALSSILVEVPVYGYDLNKIVSRMPMAVMGNKIEGIAKDKVLFIKIENDDMLGFRIAKDDIAFATLTHEVVNNKICLIEYNDKRAIRQVKTLDSEKVLLINNINGIRTETVNKKQLKVLAELKWNKVQL